MVKAICDLARDEAGVVHGFADQETENTALGFGLHVGRHVQCIFKSDTVVLVAEHQMIALDLDLAGRIYVVV